MSLSIAIVVAATVAAFWGVWNCLLVNLDDPMYVADNEHVFSGLSWNNLYWATTSSVGGLWHPLTLVSLQLDASLFGGSDAGYHATNLTLHVINALVLMWLWRRMTGGTWSSVIVALLFAVHPLHVESVAWVSERKDVLSTLFGLLALTAYVRYAEAPSPARYSAVAACLFLSLLAKPMLVTLPCLLLVLDAWPLARTQRPAASGAAPTWPALVAEKIPLLVLAAVISIVTAQFQSGAGALLPLHAHPLANRVRDALNGYQFYLTKTVWPADLAVYYPRLQTVPAVVDLLRPAALLATLTALAIWQRRGRPYLLAGWLWFVGTLVPVIGLVQVGDQAYADRYTYFPLIGLFGAFGAAVDEVRRQWPRAGAATIGVACLGIAMLAVKTHRQVGYWRDSETLWRHTLAVTDDNYIAHALFANVLAAQGHIDQFAAHSKQSLRIFPSWTGHMRFAHALETLDRYDEALEHYRAAIEFDPRNPESHLAAGALLHKLRRFDDARQELEKAVSCRPDWPEAWNQLGAALAMGGHGEQALRCHAEAAGLDPSNARYRVNLADALEAQGEMASAREQYRLALRLDPQWPDRAVQASWTMGTSPDPKQRNGAMALRMAKQACLAVDAPRASYLDTLAAAYAETGDFDRAEIEAARAVELARASGDETLARQIERRLDLYRRQMPFRDGD